MKDWECSVRTGRSISQGPAYNLQTGHWAVLTSRFFLRLCGMLSATLCVMIQNKQKQNKRLDGKTWKFC